MDIILKQQEAVQNAVTKAFPSFVGIVGILVVSQFFIIPLSMITRPLLLLVWSNEISQSLLARILAYADVMIAGFLCLFFYSVENCLSITQNWWDFIRPILKFSKNNLKSAGIIVPLLISVEICIFSAGFVIIYLAELAGYSVPQGSASAKAVLNHPWLFIFPVFFAPIFEETLFRGIILQGFLTRYSVPRSIIVSSLFFGLWHLTVPQFISGVGIGVLLGWLFVRTRSLPLCILCHGFANALLLSKTTSGIIALCSGINLEIEHSNLQPLPLLPLWLFAVALFVAIASIIVLHRSMPNSTLSPLMNGAEKHSYSQSDIGNSFQNTKL